MTDTQERETLMPDGSHDVRCKCPQCWLCAVCDSALTVAGRCTVNLTHHA